VSLAEFMRKVRRTERPGARPERAARSAAIFVSHAREDGQATRDLVARLERMGFKVAFDGQIVCGDDFSRWIERQIDAADAVIVLWTDASIASPWVRSEAQRALAQRKLIPLTEPGFDRRKLPLPFSNLQTNASHDEIGIRAAVNRVLDAPPRPGT